MAKPSTRAPTPKSGREHLGRLFFLLVGAAGFAGCAVCDGELRTLAGAEPLAPGESITLAFYMEDNLVAGPKDNDAFWYVEGIEGGDTEVGTITSGVYTAPQVPPSSSILIMASTYAVGQCADCCPHATRELQLSAAP